MPTNLGVNFGREFFGGGLKSWKNKAEKFAEKKRHQIFAEKFAGNFPEIRWT